MAVALTLAGFSFLSAHVAATGADECLVGLHVKGFGAFDGDYTDQLSMGYSFIHGRYQFGSSFTSEFGPVGCEDGCSDIDANLARGKWVLMEAMGSTKCGRKSVAGTCKLYAVCEDCPPYTLMPTWPAMGSLTTTWRILGNNATAKVSVACCKRRSNECDQCSHEMCGKYWMRCPPPSVFGLASRCCETVKSRTVFNSCGCKDTVNECDADESLTSVAV
eukprot:TRINITY_DN52687_c0_g1_i1.p1 TRINITY_DN52687_c0_g1~~TRINITY_DN52687_c0_g1_i1.p1  ORF type:complete len:219 (+),score=22.77 TRINITY_DN52687_c0_g1_i1:90-746(+)